MKITPVDDKNTLFLIEDILSEETLNKMDELDLLDVPGVDKIGKRIGKEDFLSLKS